MLGFVARTTSCTPLRSTRRISSSMRRCSGSTPSSGEPLRGPAADAGQAGQLRDEILDGRREHPFRLALAGEVPRPAPDDDADEGEDDEEPQPVREEKRAAKILVTRRGRGGRGLPA